ncbi:GGDEF domain-containing protein [Candidatus Oleimmundimicrobium sp.]|uniref:GGDEF domain-containing protein n=1 Tax=Candidatus Oleimmundimicrobium sp. TaxID=3060597 RepID=UPI00271AF00B|nr:GGDEF domain-containing protein [Candidatus Oleimmundimicrobium sp.]MDO8886892.1 GGDEF domain-containing protein [Candidatus Oleimmundimicrobium sp.]
MKRGKYLRSVLVIVLTFAFANLVIYFSFPHGVLTYWTLYVVPLVIAAMVYDIYGVISIGLMSIGAISWWLYSSVNSPEFYQALSVKSTIVEIVVGVSIFLLVGSILGVLSKKQKKQQMALELLSVHDRLTGLFNYSYFLDRMEEEKKRADRYEKELSFIMMDIDHFKHYNDTYGHEQGNVVLKKIAKTIRENTRDIDIVSRYGGEEFVVLLPRASKEQAVVVAERIRKAVESLEFPGNREQPVVKKTISGGVATYPHDAKDASGLVVKADEALYEAKESGRNKTCVAS